MKIAILIDELAFGSAPKVIGQTVKGLGRLGHDCEALVLIDDKLQDRFPEVYNYHLSGIKIKYIFGKRPAWDFKLPGFSFFSLHHVLSFFKTPLVTKRREYDIIIANSQSAIFAAWGLRIFRKIPYIFYIHCDPVIHTLKKTYLKTWLRIFYPLLYIFAFLLDRLAITAARASIVSGKLHRARFSNIANKNLENLRLGCFPLEEFRPYSQREKAMLTYDRWDIGNRPHIFLDLLENIDTDSRLKIGGFWHPESMKEDFLREMRKKKLENRIDLLGPLDENKIQQSCSRLIAHVHINQEAFGMHTLEAAACGSCIIIPSGSGVADLFEHGVHGYFPRENNLEEFARYVNMIFSDIKKAEEMGNRAWQVAKNYTWSHYANNLNKIIVKYT